MYDYPKMLLKEARELLDKPAKERLSFVRKNPFISYERSNSVLKKLEALMDEPKKPRMPCLLIVGSSNNGKTSIVKSFFKKHPPTDLIDHEAMPVVYVNAPPKADFGYLYDKILEALAIPFKKSDPLSQKEYDIRYYFKFSEVKILIIDEIHNILGGTATKQREYMNAVKNLSNELEIPIVLVGTKDALNATSTDLQISSRFKPIPLPLWKMDSEFYSLVYGVERSLPLLKASKITNNDKLMQKILSLSEGLIGEIMTILHEAAQFAIESGSERIGLDEIKAIKYVPLSQRRILYEEDI